MRSKGSLNRVTTALLATGLAVLTIGAGKTAGVPGFADGMALAGSLLANPVAAIDAAGQMLHGTEAIPIAQTELEDTESPAVFEEPTAEELLPSATPVPSGSAPEAPEITPPPEGMGTIANAFYGQGSGTNYAILKAGTIKNCTTLPISEIAAAANAGLPFSIDPNSTEPQVLIMHTHATESFELEELGWFDPAFTARRTDNALNMVAVGAEIAAQLNAAGIVTVQDATLHDYPSYNGSYERSNATVQKYLEKYPSIKVVLDVHRDAIETNGERVAAVADINGQTAAQIMLICGADKNGNLPNFKQNLGFAAAFETAMESRFPGLTRPILFDYRYYNQDLTTGSLLIEIGSHGNTLAQAKYSGQLVGQALVGLFTTGA